MSDLEKLRSRIKGPVTTSTDPEYESLRRSMVWNGLIPDRRPAIIVRVANETDVVEALRFARSNNLTVAVRGGGHNWVAFALRDDSLLIDLARLDQVAIASKIRRAVIGPAVTGRELNRQLAPHGLAFPVGHCPTVKLSGFLLNGGLGWNFGGWGPACFSIEAARVVDADGNLITVSDSQNPDLLWAIRGSGPLFFGVVTQYTLRLFPAPRAITSTNHYFPLDCAGDIGGWAGEVAGKLPKNVEFTILLVPAPPQVALQCSSGNGLVFIVTATAFVDTAKEAADALERVNSCPLSKHRLQMELNLSTPLDALLDIGGMLWPEDHRYLADTLWTNSPASDVLSTLRRHFLRAPSAKSQATFVLSTGGIQHDPPRPDGAYSMVADSLTLCYGIWQRPEDDAANLGWHREAIADLDRFAVGHYIGESDIIADPRRAERSFSPANWKRLAELRQKFDPGSLFHVT